MAEIVRLPLIADDPPTPEFVDMINELVLTNPGGRDHQTNREGPTDDRRHLGESPSPVRELAQSGAQHRPHRRREHRLTSIRGDPGSKNFDHKEWVAFGLAPESCRQFRINRV